jgi:hypothetical protein
MANTFNLSIKDYNINELKELLNLVEPYTLEDIVNQENDLREKLLMDTAVSGEKKKDIIKFLESVKDILIENSKQEFNNINNSEIITSVHPVIKKNNNGINVVNAVARDKIVNRAGNINVIKKLLCVDSKFRDNYYTTLSTNYTLTLPTVIKNVISMELSAIELPSTNYQISNSLGNNYFYMKCDNSYSYIEIPDGNYDLNAMTTTITNEISCNNISFNISQISGSTSISGESISVYFNKAKFHDASSSKHSISESSFNEICYDVDNNYGLVGNLGWILGFRLGEYVDISNLLISEGSYDGWGSKYLYVIVNDFNKNVNNFCVPTYNESLGKSNVLARISREPLSSDAFQKGHVIQKNNLVDDCTFRKREYFGPVDINKLELQIVDELGRIVDLNNMDYSMALNLVCLYD